MTGDSRSRELLFAWLHLTVLWAFALARPLFAVLEDSPEFFVARGNTSFDIAVLALAVTLVPPTLLLAVEAILIPWRTARRALHLVFVTLLLALIALQLLEDLGLGSALPLILLSLALGAAGAFLYASTRFVPTVVSVLALAPVLFLLNFLFISPVSDLFLSQEDEGAAASEVGATPGGGGALRRVLGGIACRTRRPHRRQPLPELRAAGTELHLVPQCHHRGRRDHLGRARRAHGPPPHWGQLPIAADHPTNIFTLLGDRYRLNVSEPATDLCPERLCGGERRPSPTAGCEGCSTT